MCESQVFAERTVLMQPDNQSSLALITPKTLTAFCVGASFCCYIMLPGAVLAETWTSSDRRTQNDQSRAPAVERRSGLDRRASTRFGVSVTVLPACAISVNATAIMGAGQPVEIQCTQNNFHTIGRAESSTQNSPTGLGAYSQDAVNGLMKAKDDLVILTVDF